MAKRKAPCARLLELCLGASCLGLSGCALQATSGVAAAASRPVDVPLSMGAMSHVPRISSTVVGARVGGVFQSGLAVKHVIVHGGYDIRIRPGAFVIQPAVELGAGSPVSVSFRDPGAYLGVSAATRLRFCGTGEEPAAFNVLAMGWDFVVVPRIGGWMPPEQSGSARLVGEWAVEAGIRVTLGSDIFSPTRGKVEERAAPGGHP
jgi:hypothetical protein